MADADLPVTLFAVLNVALAAGARRMVARHLGLAVCAVVSGFEEQAGVPEGDVGPLVAFPGGTIGNLLPAQRAAFLTSLRARLRPGDALLPGTDLIKAPGVLGGVPAAPARASLKGVLGDGTSGPLTSATELSRARRRPARWLCGPSCSNAAAQSCGRSS